MRTRENGALVWRYDDTGGKDVLLSLSHMMRSIVKHYGTSYGEVILTRQDEGLRYWVTLTLYNDQHNDSFVLCRTDDLIPAEGVYYQTMENLARH